LRMIRVLTRFKSLGTLTKAISNLQNFPF
jgi:hypothetical protein